ncbi:MAG: serine hydrolase domain-containing protein [Blastocatellales bacterium]
MKIKTLSGRMIAALASIVLASVVCPAQSDDQAAKVDRFIADEMQRQKIPGLSIAVVRDGRIEHVKGYGLASVEHEVPVKPETIFQSGSVGKQFTAAAVMLLVEDGKIGLDDPITRYFNPSPAHWKGITVRHLLTHTAGTTDYPDGFDFRIDYSEDDLLKVAAGVPLAFQPGERWSYSNLGYVMLGILIGKVSGKFYGDFLQERVFRPLEMTTARIISEEDIVPNRSSGYRLVKGELKHHQWVAPRLNTTADGSLYLTALDLAKWDAALYGEKLLKKTSLDQIWTPVRLNNGRSYPYGFGWDLKQVGGRRLIEHGGSWQGFKSFIARYVDDRLTVIVLANLAQTNPDRIAHGVAALYDPKLAVPDNQLKMVGLTVNLKLAFSGQVRPEAFTPEARGRLLPDAINRMAESLKPYGVVQSVSPAGRTEHDGLHTHLRCRIAFDGRNRFCRVVFDRDFMIADLELLPE